MDWQPAPDMIGGCDARVVAAQLVADAALTAKQAEVMSLRHGLGMGFHDVALEMGMGYAAVKMLRARAWEKMRRVAA
jgi:DNA-directed RNA polymerase specialized sigma24 family protein